MRTDKINYYLNIAEEVSKRGTCLRTNYGAVIVKNDEIISTGYTGSPRGCTNCNDINICRRKELGNKSGDYTNCRSVHAEMNAVISAERSKMLDSTLYLVGIKTGNSYKKEANCCDMCKRIIINSGIKTVYVRDTRTNYRKINVSDWIDNNIF